MPKVSVIIPTYNRAELLRQAVESALAQTFNDLEVVITDDGSSDETAQVAASFGERVRCLLLPHSGLPAAARNAALQASQSEYVAFLDSDDTWFPEKVVRQVERLEQDPEAGIACSNALALFSGKEKPGAPYLHPGQGASGWALADLLQDNFIITSTAVVRRSLLEQTGLFDEQPELRALEDYDLWLRLAAISKVIYLFESLAVYRDTTASSIRSQRPSDRYWSGRLRVLENLQNFLAARGESGRLPSAAFTGQISHCRRRMCIALWQEAQLKQAAVQTWALLRDEPGPTARWLYQRVRYPTHASRISPMDKLLANAPDGLKLHLGCGQNYLPGYLNIDYPPGEHTVQLTTKADQYSDIKKLEYAPGSVAVIRLHHVFEHFDRVTALSLLLEWYSWLKEGGLLVIETPDFEKSAHAFIRNLPSAQMKILRHIFGSQEASWATHYDGWYREKFHFFLETLGYRQIRFYESEWKGTYNITVAARKLRPFIPSEEQLAAADVLLRLSLVDESASEQEMLMVWRSHLKDRMHKE